MPKICVFLNKIFLKPCHAPPPFFVLKNDQFILNSKTRRSKLLKSESGKRGAEEIYQHLRLTDTDGDDLESLTLFLRGILETGVCGFSKKALLASCALEAHKNQPPLAKMRRWQK